MPAEPDVNERLRRLPAVDEVLRSPGLADLLGRAPRWAVVAAVRDALERLRQALRGGPALRRCRSSIRGTWRRRWRRASGRSCGA